MHIKDHVECFRRFYFVAFVFYKKQEKKYFLKIKLLGVMGPRKDPVF